MTKEREIKDAVRDRYGKIAKMVTSEPEGPGKAAKVTAAATAAECGCVPAPGAKRGAASCCGPTPATQATQAQPGACSCGCSGGPSLDGGFGSGLYGEAELAGLPGQAVEASLGCGNPLAFAQMQPGETVLDLGSGGGIDVLLAAKRVGPAGKVWGLDFTDEMLELARRNQKRAGAENVEFIKGDIEAIPLPDGSVDMVISNCVINLAVDKPKVFREIFRVLRPGGRISVSDMVFQGDKSRVPAEVLRSLEAWGSCVAGALSEEDYLRGLAEAGLVGVTMEVSGSYGADLGVRLVSGLFRARKPGVAAPCGAS